MSSEGEPAIVVADYTRDDAGLDWFWLIVFVWVFIKRETSGVVLFTRMLIRSCSPFLLPVAAVTLFAGCKEGADKFFSGRPSEMAMVHNRIIGGPPEAMVELLRVPSRFPDATESQIADWQESVIAWWRNPEKHELMIASFGKISREEAHALRRWVRVRDKHRSKEKAQMLDEIEVAINGEMVDR